MLLLGLILIALGALAIVAAVFATDVVGTVEFLGQDISALALFLIGLGSGVAILLGFSIFKWGTKRGLARRREQKKLDDLSQQLDRRDAERRLDADREEDKDRPTI